MTSMLQLKDVQEKFKEIFPKPKFDTEQELLAPPLTKNYSIVGQAFDYLFRFILKQKFPDLTNDMGHWIAEHGVSELKGMQQNSELHKDATNVVATAKSQYSDFLLTGTLTNDLIQSCILLAKLDLFFRIGEQASQYFPDLLSIDDQDVQDLKNLVSIVPFKEFNPKFGILLNPTFGFGSIVVGGADVDLIVDDVIIDIKTTKKLYLSPHDWHQIMGYFSLYHIDITDAIATKRPVFYPGTPKHTISKVGIYFARYGFLFTISVKNHITDNKKLKRFSDFTTWLKNRGDKEFGWRDELKKMGIDGKKSMI